MTLLVIVCAALYSVHLQSNGKVIRADGHGYYAYLRAYLIHREPDFARIPWPDDSPESIGFYRHPQTGRLANQYPVGTALAELPFFVAAHAFAATGGFPRDGLSPPYQWAIRLAAWAWFLAGLAATWRYLAHRFGTERAAVATAAIALGTNLLHYGVADGSMSHAYAFGALGLLLWHSDRFWPSPSRGGALWFGLLAGLLVSIRAFDVLLTPLALYPALQQRRRAIVRRHAVAFAGAFCLALLPHLLTAYYYLGAPWRSTYPPMFTWTRPQLFLVLFSVHKGWFFWTPLALAGVGGLIVGLRRGWAGFCAPALAALALLAYIISCWASPDMGQSFGHRGFIEFLPAVGFGIALLCNRHLKVLAGVLIAYNLFLLQGYWDGRIAGNFMNWKAYKRAVVMPLARAVGVRAPQDSSQREGLAAQLEVLGIRREAGVIKTAIRVRNTGSTLWLDSGLGEVQLAVRPWERADCSGKEVLDYRQPLRTEVRPGQTLEVRSDIRLSYVPRRFDYFCIEMVAERVTWFRDVGSPPLVVKVDPTLLQGWTP